MKIFKRWPNRLIGILVLALACQLILLGSVVAQDDSQQRRRTTVSPDDVRTKSIDLRITGKRPDMIMTQRINFLVTESTEVVDRKGNVMSLADLPVPCTAKIFYAPGGLNHPVVWRIVYKGLLSGAKTAWSSPIKQ
jgi:hypothetical protein